MAKKGNNQDEAKKELLIDEELCKKLLELSKAFKNAEEGMEYMIPAPGEGKKKYEVISIDKDEDYRSETFRCEDYVGAEPMTRKRNIALIAKNSNTVLCRFDLGKCPPHTNPDTGAIIRTSHMHLFTRGNASSIAYELPPGIDDSMSAIEITMKFLDYCHIDRSNVYFMEDLFS